ncbi:MAG: hypothetical protein ACQ9ET_00120 [Nitrosomonadaceae bacterium]
MKVTKRQKAIIDAHVEAFKAHNFTYESLPAHQEQLFICLDGGESFKELWDLVWDRSRISITSQLMASHEVFGVLSGTAEKSVRRAFISFLRNNNIV